MNYLLHCWLARSDPGLQAGGFLGDFIKGKLDSDIPADLKRGLLLHRHIDAQSNLLPSMRSTYHRFGTELRRPAPVLLDLVADHILAKYWSEFGAGELATFTHRCYERISRYDIPPSARRLFDHMRNTDLMARYAQLEVVEEVMVRILKRLRFDAAELQLAHCLREQGMAFKTDFARYFRDLQMVVDAWLDDENSA